MKNSSMNKSVLSDNSNELPPEKTSSILSNQSSIKDTTKKYLSLQDYYREIKSFSPSTIHDDQMEFIIYYMIDRALIRPMGIFSGRIYRVYNEINQYVLRRSNGQITWYPYVSTNPALKADYFYIMEHTPAKSKLYNLLITIDGSNYSEIFVYGEMFAGFSFRSGSVELKGHLFMTHMYPEPNVCAVEDVLESDILIEITAGTLIVFICDNKDVVILPGDDCKMRFTTENEQVLEQFQKTQKPFSKIVSSPPSKIAQQSMDSTNKIKSPKKKNDSLSELIDLITLQKSTKSLLIIENAFDMETKQLKMSPTITKSDKQKSPLKKVSIKKSKESLSSKISGKQMRKSIKHLSKSRKFTASNKHSASPSSKKSKPAKIDSPIRKDDKHRIDSSESLKKNLSSLTIDKTPKNEIENKEKSPESKEKISPPRKSTSRMVKKRRRRSRERMVKLTRSKLANSMLKSRSLLSNKSSLYPIDSEILNRIVKKVSSMNKDDNIIANETVVKSPFPEIVGEEKSSEKFNETKLMIIQKLIENPSLLSSSSSREKILRQLIRIIKYLKERNNNEPGGNSKELDTNLQLLQNQLENYERILTNSSSNTTNNDQQKQLQILTYSILESLKILNQIIKNKK